MFLTGCKTKNQAANAVENPVAASGSAYVYIDTTIGREQIKVTFKQDTLLLERKTKDSNYAYISQPVFDPKIQGGINVYDGKNFHHTDFLVVDSFYLLAFRTSDFRVSVMTFNRNQTGFHFFNQSNTAIGPGSDPYLLGLHSNFVIYNQLNKTLIYFNYHTESISNSEAVKKCDAYMISFADYSVKENKKPIPLDGNEFLNDSLVEMLKRKLVAL